MTDRKDLDKIEYRNLGGPGGTGPAASVPGGFRHGVRAFRYRNYRLFFFGALVSNSGNWLQNLAVPFVLFELTQKSLWVGLAGFAQFIPSFFLGPLGGSMADRLDRRVILLVTQAAMAAAAFALWASWAVGWRNPYLILAITALTGVFNGLMIPSWQAFVPSLVPRDDLPSAITLNSTQFNAARAVGPALAGIMLATGGAGWAFFLNGVSFVAVIAVIWVIRPLPGDRRNGTAPDGVLAGFTSAIAYMRARTGITIGVLTTVLVAFFGNPITQFTVVFADQVYQAGPRVLGVLAAAVGIGAVLVAPILSSWDTRIPRSVVVRWGLPAYATAVMGVGLAPTWPLGLAALLLVGGGFLAVVATTNTAVQVIVADHMRGRVMSVRVMGFTLAFPICSLAQGFLADIWGPQATVTTFGAMLLAVALYLSSKPALLAGLDHEDDTPDRLDATVESA
ncbi:MAG: MFS transporter [Acidimicrobiales bacterium]